MKNNEKFLKNWEKNRQKRKSKFIVSNILIFSVTYWITSLILDINRGYGLSKLTDSLPMFIAMFIGGTVGINLNWYKNENKYSKLMRNK